MLRPTVPPAPPVLGRSPASRRAAPHRSRPTALPGSDPSGVDGGGDLDVGLWKSGGGGGSSAPSPAAPPPPAPAAPLPQELVNAGVTAIHTNLPIPGATRAGGGGGGGGGGLGITTSTTAASAYAHSAMVEGGAGFWYRATNNAATAPRMFWDRLGDGFAWRNKPTRASGDGSKPAFMSSPPRIKAVATTKGFGAADAAPPALAPTSAPAWFPGGTTSLAWNAVDRHVEAGQGDRVALIGAEDSLTFDAAARAASTLAGWMRGAGGVGAGGTVAVLLPACPTAGVAALAVSRAGCGVLTLDPAAPAASLAASLSAAAPRVIITSSPAKASVDAAIAAAAASTFWAPDTVLVYEVGDVPIAATPWSCGRDVWAHAALPMDGAGGDAPPTTTPAPAWVDAGSAGVLLPSASTPSTVFVHPAAGYCVGAGATARLAWDVRVGDVVAVAAAPGSPTAALAFWGALLNCGAVASLPPLLLDDPSPGAVAASASAWLRAAASAGATHIIAGSAAAAHALACADPAAVTAAVAGGLRLASLAGPDPDPRAVGALAGALPPTLPLTAAWLPDGAGTPPLAGIPGPAAPTTPASLRPFLRSAGDWTTAWPAVAGRTVPAGAWRDALLDVDGTFAHQGAAWAAVEGGDGEVWWAEK